MSISNSNLNIFPRAAPLPPPVHHPPSSDNGNASIAIPPNPAPTRPPYPHIRSCLSCRHRKVKCDRQLPCSNCQRAGSECIFPPGPGRAPKRPRAARDPHLLERLWKLERIVRRLGAEEDSEDENSEGNTIADSEADAKDAGDSMSDPSIHKELGRLLIDDSRSCYVGNRFWASLGDEIEELRDLLHQPRSDNGDCSSWQSPHLESPFPPSDASLFGHSALARSLFAFHPPIPQLVILLDAFTQNVAPLVRIFHMPSMIEYFWNSVASFDSLDNNAEALMFAMYYAAIISMSPEQCQSELGATRPSILEKYRFIVEQALARANLLNTQSFTLIQAAVLFLSALRNEDDSRTVWSMTALIFHLAQAIGLHRDGVAFGLKPFETEMRRRLWWHICLLDARSSEDHGCELIVHDAAFDTKLPSNVNDEDLSPQMTEFPKEREGATDMTFCLLRSHVTRTMRQIGYVPPSMRGCGQHQDGPSCEGRKRLMRELQELLEQRYIRHCNPAVPIFLVSITVARLIIERMWLAEHHPMSRKDSIPLDIRDRLFQTSIKVVELSVLLFTTPGLLKWNWYFKTHIQWHAVAFVLSEICSRPASPECDRAWLYVTAVYDRWESKDKDRKGNPGRLISRLMAKAFQVRENQRSRASTLDVSSSPSPNALSGTIANAAYPPSETYHLLPTASSEEITHSGMDTPMELPRDPLFGELDHFSWDSGAPTGPEPTNTFQPFAFDPGIFPSVPNG